MGKTQLLRNILIFFIVVAYSSANGQYVSAIINDSDGYTNVRSDSTTKSKIIEKFIDGEVFEYNGDDWCEKKNWIHVGIDRTDNKDKCNYLSTYGTGGYMHRSRVLPMDKLPNNFNRTITESSVELAGEHIVAKIEIRNLSQKEIDILSRDGCIWGTDMGNPRNVLTNVQLELNGTTVSVPSAEYKDLYRATLSKSFIKTHKNFVYLMMSNSDAAGFYEVIWVFKDAKYQRRYINTGP